MTDWKITRATKVHVVGTANKIGEACLVLIYPPGPDLGKRFPLSRSEVVLGRGGDCDVQVDRDSISRRHARVFRSGENWLVEDLQSTNGSYLNDAPVTKEVLHDGDFLKIGGVIFKFLRGTGIEASYHEEIYKLTIMDALTGAHNKRYFLEFLEREIVRCARYRRPLSLLMFDIDHFKAINDKHGYLTGDHVLRELSRRLLGRVQKEALLARYGGEEFAVVLPESDLAAAQTFGEQIRRLVGDQPFKHESDAFPVTVSVGVACVEGEDVDIMSFIKLADDNLYRAKREGRNRVIAGAKKWHQWKADPAFRSQVSSKAAVAALCLLARDQILASKRGAARVDDLEGLLYSHLREHQKPEQELSFGALEGGGKLLVASKGRNPVPCLRAVIFEALRRCTEVHPDARFAVGPIQLAKEGARAIEDAVAGLDEEIGVLENGYHLPQPIAVALRSLDGVTMARAKAVLELGETLLQWMSLCAAAEMSFTGDAAQTAAELRRNLAGSITMECWREVLALGVDVILKTSSVHDSAWRVCLGDKKIRDELFSWFDAFVQLRNAFSQVATSRDEHVARQLLDEAAPRLRRLVRRELRAVLALVPAEVEIMGFEGELQSYRITRLIGDRVPAPVPMYSRRRMNPGLWLCDAVADRAMPLEPFFVHDTCPKCGIRELFLLNQLDELEFRNPVTGHVLKKPIDDMPFSPTARERLMELSLAPSAGASQSHEMPEPSTLRVSVHEDDEVLESQHLQQPEHGPAAKGLVAAVSAWGTRILRRSERGRTAADRSLDKTVFGLSKRAPQPESDPSVQRSSGGQHTILFLAANPAGIDRLALDREARAIQVELERSGFRDCFELVTRWATEPLDLLRELRKLRPTVIHFSGRGDVDGQPGPGHAPPRDPPEKSGPHEIVQSHGLYFQGPDGRPHFVSTSALEETFGAAGSSVKLVVLSACYSEVQAEALLAHIDCVVGTSGSFRDDVARNFAIGFYGGLGERESVEAAYKQGRAAISLEGLPDGARPQLKVRAGVDAAKLVLAAEP